MQLLAGWLDSGQAQVQLMTQKSAVLKIYVTPKMTML